MESSLSNDVILKSHQKILSDRSESRLNKFLKGLKVIIVGPDTSILGTKLGSFIESFDVVVRINTAYNFVPFKKEWVKDIGSRTDIFYMAPSSMKWIAEKDMDNFYKRLQQSKCKFLCYQNGHNGADYITGDYVYPKVKEVIKAALLSPKKPKDIRTQLSSSHDSCLNLCKLLSKVAGETVLTRTGLLAIWDCLNHGAASVTVTGMSFYHGGGHLFRVVEGELDPLRDHLDHKSYHNSNIEVILLRQMIEIFGPEKIILRDRLLSVVDG